MTDLLHDIRYAVRVLVKSPGFSVIALIALAIGIGANTAIFSVVDAVLLRPLPVAAPQDVLVVHNELLAIGLRDIGVSAPDFADISQQKNVFESAAVVNQVSYNLTGADRPERLVGLQVSKDFFPLMGVKPKLGRWLLPEEDRPGADRSVLLTEGVWRRLFGSDPKLVGKTIELNGETCTVVGIMPASFVLPSLQADLWRPLALKPEQLDPVKERGHQWLYMVGRLAPGVGLQQAQAAMDLTAKHFQQLYPNNFPANIGYSIHVLPLLDDLIGSTKRSLLVLLTAVAFVLLIACSNVANLMLARASTRHKEIAIRAALGAGRRRLMRQLLTECLVLALAGGGAGLLLAYWGLDALRVLGADSVPRLESVQVNSVVLAFTLGVSVFAGIIFGLMPALQMSQSALQDSLKEGGRGGTAGAKRHSVRAVLVVAEMALSLVLLVGAGLMIRSFWGVERVSPGFEPRNILTMQLALPGSKYPQPPQMVAFYQTLLSRVSTLPGVEAAAAVSTLPFSNQVSAGSFDIEGRRTPPGQAGPHADVQLITPEYFKVMRVPLQRGRYFFDQDAPSGPKTAIIDSVLAKAYWPNEDPIGKKITFSDPSVQQDWMTVVGIVGNVQSRTLDAALKGAVYMPYAQNPFRMMALTIRSKGEPEPLTAAVRSEVANVDKDQPIYDVKTMEQRVTESVMRRRFSVLLLSTFAGAALLLAAVGIYGVISYAVTQRTHEIGIRMALGAARADVLRLVVKQGLTLVAGGVIVGLGGALAVTRLMSSLLFGVSATDLATFVMVSGLLVLVALVASYLPARRATAVDPIVALRYE